ncbi:MAG: SPFH domain-containing protein [Propionibacteriaceae bacterium]|jgi:regulator of protease activity HflC (stomatin/prohibitin superfamily)|nr:SPFH domain-containing protein [Propionibacteriaceae bacterium]
MSSTDQFSSIPSASPQLSGQGEDSTHLSQESSAIHERSATTVPGLLAGLVWLIILALGVVEFIRGVMAVKSGGGGAEVVVGIIIVIVAFLLVTAFTVVQPGQTKVLQFLGNYVGTVRATGLRMTYPFTTKRVVSVKVRNFETREIKVNDSQGNPVMIAAIIVWQVNDTAQSVFRVEHYEQFVEVQSEAALRHIATVHPYDNGEEGEATLRGATDQVAAELAREVSERVDIAGVDIVETRISSLSYAPEIASAMLQRQQAQAVLAARAKIVEGAVTMVESALERIEREGIVSLDEDRKAAMVSNLLVVLCSDSRAMPTVNTGS